MFTAGETINLNKLEFQLQNTVYKPTLPIQLNGTTGQFTDLSIGSGSICLIANENGNLNTYCLGDNSEGQIVVGITANIESQPILVNTVIDVESVELSSPGNN